VNFKRIEVIQCGCRVEIGGILRSVKNSWKCLLAFLIIACIDGCGNQENTVIQNAGGQSSIVPEGAIWSSQTIRTDTPPSGYGAIVIWAQTATLKGGQSKSIKAFVTVDYWKIIEEINAIRNVIYQESYDYNDRKEFSTDEAGLYVRYPKWFDPAALDYHAQAFNMVAQTGILSIDVSQTPDNIVHWWTARQPVKAGAKYSVEMRLKVEGQCSVQLGADYWRNLTIGVNPNGNSCQTSNNCEAWISDWIGDTKGAFVTVTAPLR
jgi:hypothetical protein